MGAQVTTIKLDKEYSMIFKWPLVEEAERLMGGTIEDALIKRGVTSLITMLWAGLRGAEGPGLKREEVAKRLGRMSLGMDPPRYADLWTAISDALIASGILRGPEDVGLDPSMLHGPNRGSIDVLPTGPE
jgi:hypothetical protein